MKAAGLEEWHFDTNVLDKGGLVVYSVSITVQNPHSVSGPTSPSSQKTIQSEQIQFYQCI